MSDRFEVTATDGAARAAVLRTAHGDVPTPAFMPVGTKGTVKTLAPQELRELGTAILLGNTYHLHFRPGDELVAAIQGRLGSDVAMCLDICAPAGAPRAELAEAVRRTSLWAARQRDAPRPPGQLLFGIA